MGISALLNTGLFFSASLFPAFSVQPLLPLKPPLQGSLGFSFYFQILSLCPLFLYLLLKLSSFPPVPIFPFLDVSDVSGFPAFGFPSPPPTLVPVSFPPSSQIPGEVEGDHVCMGQCG